MITLKTAAAFASMKMAGRLLARLFQDELPTLVRPGVTTLELDSAIARYLQQHEMVSQSKGYHGYRHVSCVSVNDEVVHGVPSSRVLFEGDLVKIDVCAAWHGYCADMARCYAVGAISSDIQHLVKIAQDALDAGIAQAVPHGKLGDISAAIQKTVEQAGYGVVRDFAGHGIGRSMHEDPEVLNYGSAGRGVTLKPGMAFALEPMITKGKYDVYVDRDGWTVKTIDRSCAAHVEDTVFVTEQGPVIMTRLTE